MREFVVQRMREIGMDVPGLVRRLGEISPGDPDKSRDESTIYKLLSGESARTPILPEILLALGSSPDLFADQQELARRLLQLFHAMWALDDEYARDFVGHARLMVDGLRREKPAPRPPLGGAASSSAASGRTTK